LNDNSELGLTQPQKSQSSCVIGMSGEQLQIQFGDAPKQIGPDDKAPKPSI
jgi:hypothetical protein